MHTHTLTRDGARPYMLYYIAEISLLLLFLQQRQLHHGKWKREKKERGVARCCCYGFSFSYSFSLLYNSHGLLISIGVMMTKRLIGLAFSPLLH